ncbi:MAG: ABC transporter substrate-binding protein [Deltaproteobacteria bacterium]|nr:MAG: ABC transporter substrate-binding protein [Deltaproteobacteria bacterium]
MMGWNDSRADLGGEMPPATRERRGRYGGRVLPRLFLLMMGFLPAMGCGSPGKKERGDSPLRLFVSVLPLQEVVERIGGTRVTVGVVVAPGRSPETYDPTPRQMADLAGSRLLFTVGVPFERIWLPRIARIAPDLEVVALHEGEPLAAKGEDPHLWTSPLFMRRAARKILEALVAVDPAGREIYEKGHDAFVRELDALHASIERRFASLKSRRFLVFHPAWSAFAQTYGLEQVAVEAAGKEPGPKGLATIIEDARKAGIRAIVVQPQSYPVYARTVAEAIGARLLPLDPLAPNYLANMAYVAEKLAEAMEGKG